MPLEATVCPCMCTLTGGRRACQRYFMIRTMAVIKDLDTLWCFYVVLFLFLNNNQRGTLVSVFLPQFHKVSVLWFQLYVHVQPPKRGLNRLKKPVMFSCKAPTVLSLPETPYLAREAPTCAGTQHPAYTDTDVLKLGQWSIRTSHHDVRTEWWWM